MSLVDECTLLAAGESQSTHCLYQAHGIQPGTCWESAHLQQQGKELLADGAAELLLRQQCSCVGRQAGSAAHTAGKGVGGFIFAGPGSGQPQRHHGSCRGLDSSGKSWVVERLGSAGVLPCSS